MAWREDGHAREDYYRRNPEKKATDDALRRMPDLGSPETPTWNPLASAVIDGVFRLLADWHPQVERRPGGPRLVLPAEDPGDYARTVVAPLKGRPFRKDPPRRLEADS
jgi:hypothetical protein